MHLEQKQFVIRSVLSHNEELCHPAVETTANKVFSIRDLCFVFKSTNLRNNMFPHKLDLLPKIKMEQEWISPSLHTEWVQERPENLECRENWMLYGVGLPPLQQRVQPSVKRLLEIFLFVFGGFLVWVLFVCLGFFEFCLFVCCCLGFFWGGTKRKLSLKINLSVYP